MIELKAHVETTNYQNRLQTKGQIFFFATIQVNEIGKLMQMTNAGILKKIQFVLSSSILNVTLSFLYY